MRAGATVSLNENLGWGAEGGSARLDNNHDPHTLRWLDGPGDHDDHDEDDCDNGDDYGGAGLVHHHDPHTLRWLDGPGDDHDADEDDGDEYEGDDLDEDDLDDDDDYGGGGPSTTIILSVDWTGLEKGIIVFIRVHVKEIFIFILSSL